MEDNNMLCEIKRLEEEIRILYDTEENKRRWQYWEDAKVEFDYWRAIPKDKGHKPFIVDFERQGHAEVLGFSLREFYESPYCYVLNSLKILLHKFKNFKDCSPLRKVIVFLPGVGFEKSIFGGAQEYTEQDAWVGRSSVIDGRPDIGSLQCPDFRKSGSMPGIIEFYWKMREITDDDFQVTFPMWSRSPWGVAWHLKGIDNLMSDVIEDSEWVAGFLDYITKCRENWTVERVKFLNAELSICNIYNDEVLCPVVSPGMYENLILPGEMELSRFFGGVHYWHSCGNTTPLQGLINRIPNLHMVHISPWSSLENGAGIYGPEKTAIEVDLHAYNDVLAVSGPDEIEKKLAHFKETTSDHRSLIRAAGIEIAHDVKTDMEKIQEWIGCAHKVLSQE